MTDERSEVWTGELGDQLSGLPVVSSRTAFRGSVWDVRTDHVRFDDHEVARDFVVHPGAVGVIAFDEQERVLFIRQYRHPVGAYLFEPPAGLLDADGETPLEAAKRELREEAGYEATDWHVLIDFLNSPGGSSETFRCFLARGLRQVARELTGEAEEQHLPRAWVPIEEALALAVSGRVQNPTAVSGVLALWAARQLGWSTLRPPDSAWSSRDHVRAIGNGRQGGDS